MQPFTEEDLSILYPNPQLDTQTLLVDTFIRVSCSVWTFAVNTILLIITQHKNLIMLTQGPVFRGRYSKIPAMFIKYSPVHSTIVCIWDKIFTII